MWRWLIPLMFLAQPALAAEEVVLGLSQDQVAITATYNGSEILIFGAIKRDGPVPEGPPLEVIVAVSGPDKPVTVRRKEKRYGIWMNIDSVLVDSAPSFYAVATSGPFDEVLKDVEDLRYKVSIARAIRSVGAAMSIKDAQSFANAVVRIREHSNLYKTLEGAVSVDQQTLFRTSIAMPSNLTEGVYSTRIFLTRGGEIISIYATTIDVKKVGLERWLFNLSRHNPFWYGIMSLAIAIAAGWTASAVFQMLRRG